MKNILTVLLFLLIFTNQIKAQGCSDAGFCTMGSMKPDQSFGRKNQVKLRSVEISQYFAETRFQNMIHSTTIDIGFSSGAKNSFQFKLPYTIVQTAGDENKSLTTQGLGDISISYTRNLINKPTYQLNFTVGAKIPIGDANLKSPEGLALPMYYQTTLGTYDLVLGGSVLTRNWLFATGIQHPFNRNGNQFFWQEWQTQNVPYQVSKYSNANQLKRGTDIMLRIERNLRFSRYNAHIGLLAIHRLNNDNIIDQTGKEVEVVNSSGTVINLLTGVGYAFSTRSAIKCIAGFKLITRDKTPDGLSREYVLTIGYAYSF